MMCFEKSHGTSLIEPLNYWFRKFLHILARNLLESRLSKLHFTTYSLVTSLTVYLCKSFSKPRFQERLAIAVEIFAEIFKPKQVIEH